MNFNVITLSLQRKNTYNMLLINDYEQYSDTVTI